MSNWQLPPDFIQEYLDACKLAATDDEAFKNFRKNDRIATIIENTTKEWADRAMDKMGWGPELIESMRDRFTPTQIRYQYIYFLIHSFFRGIDICEYAEIGPGYGGLIEALHDQSEEQMFHLFDLPVPAMLQEKYLSKVHGAESLWPYVRWHELHSFTTKNDELAELCISWCAWSELSYDLRVEYAEKVISKCDHFCICSNYNKAEDLEILSKYFTGIKEYNDELVQNVIYA